MVIEHCVKMKYCSRKLSPMFVAWAYFLASRIAEVTLDSSGASSSLSSLRTLAAIWEPSGHRCGDWSERSGVSFKIAVIVFVEIVLFICIVVPWKKHTTAEYHMETSGMMLWVHRWIKWRREQQRSC